MDCDDNRRLLSMRWIASDRGRLPWKRPPPHRLTEKDIPNRYDEMLCHENICSNLLHVKRSVCSMLNENTFVACRRRCILLHAPTSHKKHLPRCIPLKSLITTLFCQKSKLASSTCHNSRLIRATEACHCLKHPGVWLYHWEMHAATGI